MSWTDVWRTFASAYPGKWACQFFPPETELVDEANIYHLFVLDVTPTGSASGETKMFSADFYPTPARIARLMLAKISKEAQNFLEPSAGKGDLAEVLRGSDSDRLYGRTRNGCRVDCIESDPELAQILIGKGFPVVGYDWLTYPGVSFYDAIVMNPPFSAGDDHLLRAWEFLHDGEIVCLLNQETIDNPYTEKRQRLVKLIMEHGDRRVKSVDDPLPTQTTENRFGLLEPLIVSYYGTNNISRVGDPLPTVTAKDRFGLVGSGSI
jgi:hypothetical protein